LIQPGRGFVDSTCDLKYPGQEGDIASAIALLLCANA
jgi:hypothetical protein